MKPIFRAELVTILILGLLYSCQSEKFADKGIMEVETMGVEILDDGVILYGEILSDGGETVTEHGFTWSDDNKAFPGNAEYINLGTLNGKTQFSVTVNSAIEKDVTYSVRAFIASREITSYGNEITFVGKGSKPAELDNVSPASAQVGDTVVINGNYFSNNPSSCSVFFNTAKANVVSSAIDSIHVVVPYVPDEMVKIRVSISGLLSSNALDFNILKPVIDEITPGAAPSGDTVVIKGDYFSEDPADCNVFFGNQEALVLSSTINEIRVIVPFTPQVSANIRVIINGIPSLNNISFEILRPVLLGIEPLTGTFGDTVNLYGNNFPTDPSLIEVFFNDVRAVVTEASRLRLKVRVPTGNNISPVTITVRYYDVYTWVDKFVLNPAVVNDVSPKTLEQWEPIVISGSNFNPDPGMNIVDIGGFRAPVISSTPNEIRVNVPPRLDNGSHQVVVTTIVGSPVTWNGYLELKTSWVRLADFPSTGRTGAAGFSPGGKIYFGTGLEYDRVLKQDFWEYNPDTDQWTTKSTYPVTIAYASGLSLNGMGYFAIGKNWSYYYTDLMRYDPVNDQWQAMAPIPGEGSSMDSPGFVIDGKAYVPAAGHMYMYDPGTNSWTEKSFPPELGYFGGGVAFSINGKGYLGIGWVHQLGGDVNNFYEYDPLSDKWTRKADFPGYLRDAATSFSLPNGKGYVGMGLAKPQMEYQKDMWEYDPVTDTWTRVMDFPGTARCGARAYVVGAAAYIVAGYGGNYEKDMWRFTPIE